MIIISQEVIFFFDDSGILHKHEPSGYFVYAGYVFTNRKILNSAKRKYIHANKKIKQSTGRTDELKAANITANQKRSLFNVVKEYDSVSAVVNIEYCDSSFNYMIQASDILANRIWGSYRMDKKLSLIHI